MNYLIIISSVIFLYSFVMVWRHNIRQKNGKQIKFVCCIIVNCSIARTQKKKKNEDIITKKNVNNWTIGCLIKFLVWTTHLSTSQYEKWIITKKRSRGGKNAPVFNMKQKVRKRKREEIYTQSNHFYWFVNKHTCI